MTVDSTTSPTQVPGKSILLTSGGTGGHIFPALAVAEALKARAPEVHIVFIGGLYGPERKLVEKAGLEFVGLPVQGVLGRGLNGIKALGGLLQQGWKCRNLLKTLNPSVVAGFGGYASIPALLGGKLIGLPLLIHEQNSIPGLSNRLMGKLAQRVCLSLEESQEFFKADKCLLTGNPVRANISAMVESDRSSPERRLLVLGGSLGAKAINAAVLKALPKLMEAGVEVLHQCGEADFAAMSEGCTALGLPVDDLQECAGWVDQAEFSGRNPQYRLMPFIDDMSKAYSLADLVLSRAGATSIAELCAAALPSILVPFPYATHDHQTHNARALEKAGAAILLPQSQLTQYDFDLASMVVQLFNDPVTLAKMSEAARNLAKVDAAEAVAQEILRLGGFT